MRLIRFTVAFTYKAIITVSHLIQMVDFKNDTATSCTCTNVHSCCFDQQSQTTEFVQYSLFQENSEKLQNFSNFGSPPLVSCEIDECLIDSYMLMLITCTDVRCIIAYIIAGYLMELINEINSIYCRIHI